MPGTLVHDSLAPVLQNGTITTTTTGSAITVNRPGKARFRLTTGTVASTSNSATLAVEIQASDDSAFSTGVVSCGQFKSLALSDALSSSLTKYLQAYVYKTYVRAVSTVGGTAPSWGSLKITMEEPNYERTTTDGA